VHEKTREKNSEQIIKRKKKNICIIEGRENNYMKREKNNMHCME